MEEDEEVELLMSPVRKDRIRALTIKELSHFLMRKGFHVDQCRTLEDNQVDGKMFITLIRSDLMNLFPSDFSARKKFWDFLSELTSSGHGSLSEWSTPLSRGSTTSPCSSSLEEDSPLSQALSASDLPFSLKRTKARHYVASEPAKKAKHCLFEKDFKLPISKKVKECVRKKIPLDNTDRRQLIRETVTCLQAYVGDQPITSSHFEELAKKLCEKVPVLRDERPPLWCDDLEFHYWASIKHPLKKRYANVKSANSKSNKNVPQPSDCGDVEIESQSKQDLEKHERT